LGLLCVIIPFPSSLDSLVFLAESTSAHSGHILFSEACVIPSVL
jgi:hypothetical protein